MYIHYTRYTDVCFCTIDTIIINNSSIHLQSRNRTSLPSYDKTDRKSSIVTSKGFTDQSQVIESSYSKHKSPIPMASISCDDSRGFEIGESITPLIGLGAVSQIESSFVFNVTFIPKSVVMENKLATQPCDDWSPDKEEQGNIM